MAADAECVHVGNVEQPGILRAVRRVAGKTAFHFYRRMFVDKWSHRLCVALGAD
jgi:hypothetical protein